MSRYQPTPQQFLHKLARLDVECKIKDQYRKWVTRQSNASFRTTIWLPAFFSLQTTFTSTFWRISPFTARSARRYSRFIRNRDSTFTPCR